MTERLNQTELKATLSVPKEQNVKSFSTVADKVKYRDFL